MPIYDNNGIAIIGKEDDYKAKVKMLSDELLKARGIIQTFQQRLEQARIQNANVITFLFHLMQMTENEKFRTSEKTLNELREAFFEGSIVLKSYRDKAKNIVVYLEKNEKEGKEDGS